MDGMIFKAVGESRPYPEHSFTSQREWGTLAPTQVRLDRLITTQRMLDLSTLFGEDSTFYGDLFPHVVHWNGQLYLEDGVHRALRTALQHRPIMYTRILDLDERSSETDPAEENAGAEAQRES